MRIQVKKNKLIGELQFDFTRQYPFLRVEFYKFNIGKLGSNIRQKIPRTILLGAAGLTHEGDMEINREMTVAQFEKTFLEKFGIMARVSRKSGTLWLETTTMTNIWTLRQQNDLGRELSELPPNLPG